MLILTLVWLAGGVLIGLLGHLAALVPRVWWRDRRASWWGTLAIGALAALVAGWLGTLLLGRFFGSPTAAWGSVLAVALVPRGVWWMRRRSARMSAEA